jgi:RNA recognition motif-containing protein
MEKDMNLYVGNVSPQTSELELRKAFAPFGDVGSISMDEHPPDSKAYNFCFVEMPFDNQAALAIRGLDGASLGGYTLTVRESGVSV